MKPVSIFLISLASVLAISCHMDGMWYSGLDYYADAKIYNGFPVNEQPGDRFDKIAENPFVKVAVEPKSTFSIDADGASYAYMRKMLSEYRTLPSANSVRIEEYLNYFTFDYPEPAAGKSISLNAETGPCPWEPSHKLLRLGLKGRSIPEEDWPTANYVFLIDVSGSMYSEDKLPLLKKGIVSMLDYLRDDDQIAIVTYSGHTETLLKPTKVKNAGNIKAAVRKLDANGSTNGGQAMKDAYTLAEKYFIEGGNNRVIMGTDGDFNVGVTSTDALLEMVQNYASKGIYLTICGFGSGNLNDSMMETVSNKGNGTYEYIDCEAEMIRIFVKERSKFVAVANDTKVQVSFNPETVDSYRLIGYENRVMENDDFENDRKDAGEIGSGQTITALYELIPTSAYGKDSPVCSFDARYKESLGGKSTPLSISVKAGEETLSANLSLAAGIASFGLVLRDSEYKGSASCKMARDLVSDGKGEDKDGYCKEFMDLISKASELKP